MLKSHKRVLMVAIIVLMVVLSLVTYVGINQHSVIPDLDDRLENVAKWIHIRYDQELRLVYDSPITEPNIYYLVPNNLYSSVALSYYYPNTSKAILQELERWTYKGDNLHEAVVGNNIPFPIRSHREITVLETGSYTIKTSMFDGPSIYEDYDQYADLLIHLALSEYWKGNTENATRLFEQASDMWDGVGVMDLATETRSLYATYKLALLLYASRIIDCPLENRDEIERKLWSMQQDDGGISTEYNLDGSPATVESNTETAPLVIIAYKYTPEEHIPQLITYGQVYGFIYHLSLVPRALPRGVRGRRQRRSHL